MSVSRKKVIVRKWNEEWLSGYLPPLDSLPLDSPLWDELGVLDLDGKVSPVRLSDVKWICFVRDFHSGDPDHPERLLAKTFSRRPRAPGLWLRAQLKDREVIEGLAQNSLSLLDPHGLLLTPPDSRSNTQRVFLPRLAIQELEILAVIRAGTPRKPLRAVQESLFP